MFSLILLHDSGTPAPLVLRACFPGLLCTITWAVVAKACPVHVIIPGEHGSPAAVINIG